MLSKYILIIAAMIGMAAGSIGTVILTKAVKPVVKLECPKAPDCNCPPNNAIDFDKVKGKNITIENSQYYILGSDTISRESLLQAYRQVALELKLSRCK